MPLALFQNGRTFVAVIAASTAVPAQQPTPPPIGTPETSAIAAPFDRLRWQIGETTVELEDPDSDLIPPDGVVGQIDEPAPDVNADGDLEAITVFGYLVGYEHHWSDAYRSTLSCSRVEGDIPDGAPPHTNERIDYLALNLIWQFADRAWTGIEYLYGSRETIDDADGEANRIQISMRFNL